MEVQLHPLLGIRGGLNAGRLSAGTAVAWRGFSVDYTYEDGDVSGIHRFGISRALGITVTEEREAASLAVEKDLQARLDEAFQKRQAKQVEDLLARVAAAQARGEYEAALDLLGTVELLYPGHPQLPSLQAASLRGWGKQLEDTWIAAAALSTAGSRSPVRPAAAGQKRRQAGDRRAARTEASAEVRRASDAFAADSPGKPKSASPASSPSTQRYGRRPHAPPHRWGRSRAASRPFSSRRVRASRCRFWARPSLMAEGDG
jgi:hypothetical protein